MTITFGTKSQAKAASSFLQRAITHYFSEGAAKIMIVPPLDSIKERPNDSDNNGSSSGGQNENSETKSGGGGAESKQGELAFMGQEEEEGEPIVEEVKDD